MFQKVSYLFKNQCQFSSKKIKFQPDYYLKQKNNESISYKRYGTFFINLYKENLIITDFLGYTYNIENIDYVLNQNNNEIIPKLYKNNLKTSRVFDVLVYKDKIFISNFIKQEKCNILKVDVAKLGTENLAFENFFKFKDCNKLGAVGKMQVFKNNNQLGLLL